LADTVAYMRAEGLHAQQQSLLTRMAIAHAHFEAVHPFRDGNGRVGRLLLPMMMAAEGRTPLYLSAYIEANKADYYAALKAAQQREDWAAMVGFLADAVVGSTTELMATRTALSRLEALWRDRRRFRAGSSALGALTILPQYPVLTIGRLAELLKVSFPAASKAIGQLCDIGVLQERTGYSRNQIFSAPEALSILNRPFGAQPVLPE
jgi:Fic family protein